MGLEKFVSSLSDWSKFPPRVLFALTLICGGFLFGGNSFFKTLGLDEIQTQYRPYFGLGFLLFGVLLISFPIAEGLRRLYHWLIEKYNQRRRFELTKEWLTSLTPAQKKILHSYIDKNTRSLRLDYKDGTVNELMIAGILYLPSNISLFDTNPRVDDGWYTDYNIQPKVYKYLQEHPELLS
ncbi:MAG: superinfection exclusion B family protein [Anaerolineales bacterium]|nr:superinfection exclusion B family protein [Anaerolineales bacterium]